MSIKEYIYSAEIFTPSKGEDTMTIKLNARPDKLRTLSGGMISLKEKVESAFTALNIEPLAVDIHTEVIHSSSQSRPLFKDTLMVQVDVTKAPLVWKALQHLLIDPPQKER